MTSLTTQANGLGLLELHCSPLEHPWLPLVSLASTGLPWAAHPHHSPTGWDCWNSLFTTGTQLVTTGTPLVTTGLTSLHWVTMGSPLVLLEHPWKHPWWNILQCRWNTGYHWNTLRNTPGINCGMMNNWLPLEYPWKHPWENLLNAEQLVTTGIPLETSLEKLMKC
jgi:hypothetical protein